MDLIDPKLGAYVRGQPLLIGLVDRALSRLLGRRPALLAAHRRVRGRGRDHSRDRPVRAGGLAIGVGLTVSWQTALAAGAIVLVVRLLEDYLVIPRVLGDAVGLTPLVVLVAVTACGLLFGGFAVILAIPLAAVLATLVDVIVRDKDPAEESACGDLLGEGGGDGRLGLPPLPEDEAAEEEAEPERTERERPDRERLARDRKPLPAPERLLLLGRQRFAAALLPQSASSPQPEVEVVEDLGGLCLRARL